MLALALAGCSPPITDAPPGYAGEPTHVGQSLTVNGAGYSVDAWAGDEVLTLTIKGSGSCPFIPEIDQIDDSSRTVNITISSFRSDEACTADEVARTYELVVDQDLTAYSVKVLAH